MEELNKINLELLTSKGYKKVQYMKLKNKNDDLSPRMILIKNDDGEIIVDGEENIKRFINQNLLKS